MQDFWLVVDQWDLVMGGLREKHHLFSRKSGVMFKKEGKKGEIWRCSSNLWGSLSLLNRETCHVWMTCSPRMWTKEEYLTILKGLKVNPMRQVINLSIRKLWPPVLHSACRTLILKPRFFHTILTLQWTNFLLYVTTFLSCGHFILTPWWHWPIL